MNSLNSKLDPRASELSSCRRLIITALFAVFHTTSTQIPTVSVLQFCSLTIRTRRTEEQTVRHHDS